MITSKQLIIMMKEWKEYYDKKFNPSNILKWYNIICSTEEIPYFYLKNTMRLEIEKIENEQEFLYLKNEQELLYLKNASINVQIANTRNFERNIKHNPILYNKYNHFVNTKCNNKKHIKLQQKLKKNNKYIVSKNDIKQIEEDKEHLENDKKPYHRTTNYMWQIIEIKCLEYWNLHGFKKIQDDLIKYIHICEKILLINKNIVWSDKYAIIYIKQLPWEMFDKKESFIGLFEEIDYTYKLLNVD